jgi:uncharacterized tellurite resistance protein B-like protein
MSLFNKFESGEDKIRKGHCRNLIKMAMADGSIDDTEMQFLYKIARRYGVTEEEVQHVMDHPNDYPFTPPSTKEDRYEQMVNLCHMVLADGVIDDNELVYSEKFAVGLGFPIAKSKLIVSRILDWIQAGKSDDDIFEALEDLLDA